MQIKEDQVKVSVTYVYKGSEDTCLPFPTEEVGKLGDAKGSFILWKRSLVSDRVLPPSVKYYLKLSLLYLI